MRDSAGASAARTLSRDSGGLRFLFRDAAEWRPQQNCGVKAPAVLRGTMFSKQKRKLFAGLLPRAFALAKGFEVIIPHRRVSGHNKTVVREHRQFCAEQCSQSKSASFSRGFLLCAFALAKGFEVIILKPVP